MEKVSTIFISNPTSPSITAMFHLMHDNLERRFLSLTSYNL
jgi:hypothetical protein